MKTSTPLLLFAVCIVSSALGACGTTGPKYVEPADTSKTSRITFSTTSSVKNVDVRAFYGEKKCKDFYSGYRVAALRDVSIFAEGYVEQAAAAFRSDEPIIITMGSAFFPAKPGRTLGRCYAHLQFTPETGKEYEIGFSEDGARCWVDTLEVSKATDGSVKKAKVESARQARGCSGA